MDVYSLPWKKQQGLSLAIASSSGVSTSKSGVTSKRGVSALNLPLKSYSKRPQQGSILRQRLDRNYDIKFDDGRIERSVNRSRIRFLKGARCEVKSYDVKPTKVTKEACSFLNQIDEMMKNSADPTTGGLDKALDSLRRYQSAIPTHEDSMGYSDFPVSPRHGWAPVQQKFMG